jgi:hypothetical protein
VFIASYLAPEDGAARGSKSQGHTGWVLPLHDKVVDSLDGVADYAQIGAAAAAAAGVPQPPQSLWLMLPNAGPCRATVGGYYAAAIDAPTKNIAYGVELSGCAAPPDPSDATAIALASPLPPSGCTILPPKPVAARVGTTDKQGKWSRPTKETPIPGAFLTVVPERTCAAPTCEKLWAIGQVEVGGKAIAWSGAVNWLEIPADSPPDQQCTWKAERFSGMFVAGPDGKLVKVTEGQDHPLSLFAVLADSGGAKIVLAAGPGEYTAYDYANGAVTVGRHLVWLVPHPESYGALDNLGPECGP